MHRYAILLVLPLGCTLTDLDNLQGGQGGASASDNQSSSPSTTSSAAGGGMATGYAAAVLDDMPMGYWRLGELGGTEALNEVDGVYSGQYLGNVTLGAVGATDGNTAARLDGVTAYMTVPDFPGFAGLLPFSVEVWVEPTLLTEVRYIFGRARYDGVSGIIDGYRLYHAEGALYGERHSFEGADSVEAPGALTSGVYSHLVLVYDSSTLALFVNGESVGAVASRIPIGAEGWFGFGADLMHGDSGAVSHFSGSIDEAAVYDYALPAEQIAAHYAAGR